MAVSEGKVLAVGSLDRDVPGPQVIDELAVGLGGVVELLERVALPVGGDVEGGVSLLAADEEDTGDGTGVVLAEDGLGTEEVLAGGLKTGVETTDQVVGHEGELQLVVVLVVDLPEGVLLGVVVLPEPGEGILTGLVVGVLALPVIEDEGGLAESLKGVLGLGLLLSGSLLGGGSSLGLLLLLGGSVLDNLLGEDGVGVDSLESVLVDDGGVPTGDGGVGAAPALVKDGSESAGEESSSEGVSKGDALTNKVSVGGQLLLKDSDGSLGGLSGLVDGLLVVAIQTEERTVPATEVREDLGVGVGQPADNGSVVLLGLAKEGGLLVLGGHCRADMSVMVFKTFMIMSNRARNKTARQSSPQKGGKECPYPEEKISTQKWGTQGPCGSVFSEVFSLNSYSSDRDN